MTSKNTITVSGYLFGQLPKADKKIEPVSILLTFRCEKAFSSLSTDVFTKGPETEKEQQVRFQTSFIFAVRLRKCEVIFYTEFQIHTISYSIR